MASNRLEPWLRGEPSPHQPFLRPVAHALQQAREDLRRLTEGLSTEQIWSTPHGMAPLGFQLRHIAGSIDRLTTYAQGGVLSESQFVALRQEHDAGAGREELLERVDAACERLERWMLTLPESALTEERFVGRDRIPTTVIGLLIHIAEHTQRHVGQALSAVRVVRSSEQV